MHMKNVLSHSEQATDYPQRILKSRMKDEFNPQLRRLIACLMSPLIHICFGRASEFIST